MAGTERPLDPREKWSGPWGKVVLWELELQKGQPLLEAERGQERWLGPSLPAAQGSSASTYH